MTAMLRQMRQSMLDPAEEETGFGSQTMTDTLDIELGRVLAEQGGLGLGRELSKALEKQIGGAATPTEQPTKPAEPALGVSPTSDPGVNDGEKLQVPQGTISSGFGWRADPFTGETRFHRGIDVALAYGRDVRAAAPGRVVFSGEQGTYGNLVVIEHQSGQQTRYAHLSAMSVQAGDQVGGGSVIGQAGHSGRATGSHLHFEVVSNGQSLDPLDTVSRVPAQGD
jgi:murein DD-endopeptidase MepM/ murein hydrolase activator NlpD